MNPGELNRLLEVQTQGSRQSDGQGGQIVPWVSSGRIWANVKELEPEKKEIAGKDTRIAKYQVKLRKRDISAQERLIYRGRVLEIDYVADAPGGPPFYLILTCKEERKP